jgi:uncharacterized tellurite resistance protein B-like protein
MMSLIRTLLGGDGGQSQGDAKLRLAVATLMVEAGTLDGHFDDAEQAHVQALLARRFGLAEAEARQLLNDARHEAERSVQLIGMTQTVKNALDYDQRVELLEMLWEVAYTDGRLHDYEANLMRRMAGLVYVSDQDAGAARKRAMARLNLEEGLG